MRSGSYFRVAATLIFVLISGAAVLLSFYRFSVTANRAAITQRDYRFLSATSSQLTSGVNALLATLPQLPSRRDSDAKEISNPLAKETKTQKTTIKIVFTTSADRLLVSLLNGATPEYAKPISDMDLGSNLRSAFTKQDFFDLVMLAKSDGTILYDASSNNILHTAGLTSLNGLADAELRHKDETLRRDGLSFLLGDDEPTSSFAKVSAGAGWLGPGQYERVRYLADEYILFAVAVPVPSSEQYLLIGLVRAKRFDTEVARFPPGWVGGSCIILYLIVFASPVLSVFLKNSRERLLKRDVLTLSLGILVVSMISILAGLFIGWHFSTAWFFDDLTKSLSDQVAARFQTELKDGSRLLEKVKGACSDKDSSVKDIPTDARDFDRVVLCTDSQGKVNGIWSVNPIASGESKPEWRFSYEALEAPIFVGDRDYFQTALANVNQWTIENRSFSLEVVLSRRDGLVNLILASAIPGKSTAEKAERVANGTTAGTVAIVSSKGLPFREPVLPVGFSFAVIDEQGMVQFHSIHGREQAENFFEETNSDRNSALQAAVSARNGRFLDVNYYGREERIYVGPIANTPWFIVTMRDLTLIRYAETEAVLAWLYLLVLYLGVCAGTVTFTRIASGRFGPAMLWPDRERGALYLRTALLLAVLTFAAFWSLRIDALGTDAKFEIAAGLPCFSLMILHLVLTSSEEFFERDLAISAMTGIVGFVLWAMAGQVILSCVVVGLTLAPFNRWPGLSKQKEVGEGPAELYFRLKYTSMLLALVVAVGITPSAIFFLDSAGRELEGVSRLAELRLFTSMRSRTDKARKDVQGFKINQKNELLVERLKDSRDIYVMDPWLREPRVRPSASACETFQKNESHKTVPVGDRVASDLLTPFWENLLLESPFAAELREVMFDAFPIETLSWHWSPHSFAATDPTFLREMCLATYRADFQTPPILNSELTWATILTGLLVCSLSFLAFRKLAAALFLLDADSNPPVRGGAVDLDFDKHWSESCEEEKLALRHLAQDGFLSRPNTGTVRKLMSRGLIVRNPALSLFDGDFCAYLLNNVPKETIRGWEAADQRSGWSQLPVILVIPAIILLLLVYPGFVTTVAGAIGALTVALPQAQGLLRSFSRNDSSGKEP